MKKKFKKLILLPLTFLLSGCNVENVTPPTPLPPVEEDKEITSDYLKLDYFKENDKFNNASGLVLVTKTKPLPESAKGIFLKWGDDSSSFTNYNPLVTFDNLNASEFEYTFMDNALIPFEATKLYLEVIGDNNEIISKATLGMKKYKKKENLKYEFQVISDEQIKVGTNAFYRRSKKTFDDIKKNSPNSIGIFVNGDIVDEALKENYESFYDSYSSVYKKEETPLYVGLGNHEFIRHNENPNYEGMSEKEIEQKFNERLNLWKEETKNTSPYFSFEKEDAKFIFLGTTKMPQALGGNTRADAYLGEVQIQWLKEEVESASNKKTFIFSHGSLRDTVSGSLSKLNQTWYGYSLEEENKIREIIKDKSNVFFFSSHSHWCFESEGAYLINESGPSFFNTAAIGYLWEGKGDGKHYKNGNYEFGGAQGLFVEVYESQMIIRGRQFEDVDGTSKYWHTSYQIVIDL